jgi:hypothetical protein
MAAHKRFDWLTKGAPLLLAASDQVQHFERGSMLRLHQLPTCFVIETAA